MMVYTKTLFWYAPDATRRKPLRSACRFCSFVLAFRSPGRCSGSRCRGAALPARRDRPAAGYQLLQRRAHCCRSGFRGAAHGSARRIADFEHDTPLNCCLLAAFDEALYDADISAVGAARVRTHAVARDTHGLHRDFGRQSDRVHFLPAGHLRCCADCRVSAAGFAGFHPAVTHAERRFAQCRSKSRAARADRRTAVLFARELCVKCFTYMNAVVDRHTFVPVCER